jgi:dipeptidyl aminopeptidase/acylaminoacyl peptidase
VAPLFGNGSERRPVRLGNVQTVADGFAVHGADWTADGRLIYSSDEPGYWNLYWWTEGTGGRLTSLTGSEIGYPPWIFGVQRWADLGDGRLAVIVTSDAVDGLMVVAADGSLSAFQPSPSAGGDGIERAATVNIESLTAVQDEGEPSVAMIAATPTSLPEIRAVPVDGGSTTVIRPSDSIGVDASWLSVPTSMWFDSDGRATQAFLYLPPAATEEPPPLIVIGHGGPTAHASPALNLKIQYWTSRGFAVADVNYGGSTGFGRDYRNRLHEAWGLVDVDDCVNAARHLADSGVVNGDRMAIRGSSAGGLTVLLALLRGDCFATGVSLYGVTDLTDLAADTHKFERHYMDWLVGPYPATIERYIERSPSSRLDDLDTPMLLMQGTDDKVVPPSQSEKVVEGLKAKNLPHLYVTFDGEGHGFRQATSLIASLEVELWFYGSIFGFEPADRVGVPESAVGFGLAGSDGPGPQHRP